MMSGNQRSGVHTVLKTTRNACGYAKKKNMSAEPELFDYDIGRMPLIFPAPVPPICARPAAALVFWHTSAAF